MLGIYILYSLLTLVLSLSGWLGISYIIQKRKKLDNLLSFSLGSLIFLTFFLLYGLFLFYAGLFTRVTILIPLVVLLPLAFQYIKNSNREVKILILFFLAQFIIGILLQLFLPYYPLGGDWFSHYQTSSDYLKTGEITFLNGRPPVFNFLTAMYLQIFSNSFWVFQIASVFFSSLLVIPIYLIAKKFNKPTAIITILFIILNSFILQNTIYTWPKNLTAYFILFFFYFMIENRSLISVLPAALSAYTNPISLFFIPAGYIYAYLKKNRNVLKSVILLALIFLPFALYSILKTGSGETTPFILYPIAVNGYERLITDTPSETFNDFLSKPPYYIVGIRVINFIMTSAPTLLSLKFIDNFVELPIIHIQKTVDVTQVPLMYHFMHSIPGSLSTIVYIFALIGLYNLFKTDRKMFLLIVLPLVFALVYWGWIKAGIINDLLQPLVPLLIMVAVPQMKNKTLVYLALAFMLFEGAVFAYVYYSSIPFFVGTTEDPQILAAETINRVLFSK